MRLICVILLFLLTLCYVECFYSFVFNRQFRTSADVTRLFKKAPKKSKHPKTTMVKLKYDVDLIGKAGEVKTVSNAIWMNMLQRKRLAFKVEQHHLDTWAFNAPEAWKARRDSYIKLNEALSALPRLNMHSHVGKSNYLLHPVTGAAVLEEIRKTVPHNLTAKSIEEIHQVFTLDDALIRVAVNISQDVRMTYAGDYELTIRINRGRAAKVSVNISPFPWTMAPVNPNADVEF